MVKTEGREREDETGIETSWGIWGFFFSLFFAPHSLVLVLLWGLTMPPNHLGFLSFYEVWTNSKQDPVWPRVARGRPTLMSGSKLCSVHSGLTSGQSKKWRNRVPTRFIEWKVENLVPSTPSLCLSTVPLPKPFRLPLSSSAYLSVFFFTPYSSTLQQKP